MKKTIIINMYSRSVIQLLGLFLPYFLSVHLSYGATDVTKNGGVNFEVVSETRKLEIFAQSVVQKEGYTEIAFKIHRRSFKSNLDRIHADIEVYDNDEVLLDSFHDIFVNRHAIRSRFLVHRHRPKKYVKKIDFEKSKIETIRVIPYADEKHRKAR